MPRLNLLFRRADYLQFANHRPLKYRRAAYTNKMVCWGGGKGGAYLSTQANRLRVTGQLIKRLISKVLQQKKVILIFSTVEMHHQSLLQALPLEVWGGGALFSLFFEFFPH